MKRLIPKPLLDWYHLLFAYGSAFYYGYPANNLVVIAITGTKGKSTTCELVRAILIAAGYKTALASTIRFAINDETEPNLFKMTMPGRGYLQWFLRKAVRAGCTHAVVEMTSEGARQFRHRGIALDALIFTNLQPEHLESHGGMEAYAAAKLSLARALEASPKRPRIIVANADDPYGETFLGANVDIHAPFSLSQAEPYVADDRSVRFLYQKELITVPLPGIFNLRNVLAALAMGSTLKIPLATMKKALEYIPPVAGRAERVERGQLFTVIIDYAHTPDSLSALFHAFEGHRRICVMGSTGGGRDQWKRPQMGAIADSVCDVAILANEDPYDENPQKIVEAIAKGFTIHAPRIVLDRRSAIAAALAEAQDGDVVLITGKGTDPFIMGPHGSKEPWSDRKVAEEELDKLLARNLMAR